MSQLIALALCALRLLALAPSPAPAAAPDLTSVQALAATYAQQVDRQRFLPPHEQARYAQLLSQALAAAALRLAQPQLMVVVDRDAQSQLAMLWWHAPSGEAVLIGASPASTGRPLGFDHFETPTGVFEHTLANLDFRAEGTRNEQGIRGYGRKGLRVFDFGWVRAARGWRPGEQAMRLQLHATDPDRLEPLLGQRRSKGCIRIPATMNIFVDRHGVLDAAYEEAMAQGRRFWVLRPDRTPTPWSGRYLVVVDSQREPLPLSGRNATTPAGATVRVKASL